MKTAIAGVLAAILVLALGVSGVWAGEGGKEKEVKVPLAELPAAVKEAAAKAVPGIVLTEAEKIVKGGQVLYYEVEGKANGKEYEIKITPEGKVLKVEQDDDDDDKDDDDDD